MTNEPDRFDAIEAVALLEEPTRKRLYDLVAASRAAVGRDEAAAALGISRELAAFHLDRLLEVGLLDTEFRRRGDRTPARAVPRAHRRSWSYPAPEPLATPLRDTCEL